MEQIRATVLAALAAFMLAAPIKADVINLLTFPAPPYQIVDELSEGQSTVHGLTVNTVRCATQRIGMTASVKAVPPRRAIEFLRNNTIDGYFAVDPSTSLDLIATRTDPISLEKWYLVSRSGDALPNTPRIGAVSGSNEEAWLLANGKAIYLTVRTSQQLINLLKRKRIDHALMDRRVLHSLDNTQDLTIEFLRYVPLHLYMSLPFVSKHPAFIRRFNEQIAGCINGTFMLDAAESAQIRGRAYDLFQSLEKRISLPDAIAEGPQTSSLAEILNLDAQWQVLAPDTHSNMARRVAETPASTVLRNWQEEQGSLVTEVMLTNSIGALVAMSQLTSDFWQGDEPKFESHIRTETRNLYVSPIRYDASTGRFQVTVSLPILVKGRWIPVGVLAIGLDAEKALTGEQHVPHLTGAPSP
ncbi:transporter substrate-binding domain-containing protein [Marinobacter sp. CHS3-4]|uniref:substrate-binding periplasmic protein n=1 Tax=Marinobacter sp. CHS3-4 TaxID=3045174 RepID=UPI0024B62A17|nr:transporter substrate-binding domain-containing protein [Marinobacter sp. CHS3-4]MDI9244504.1 transporter substrate-binding domain-containing protein [Marinobacter sp. CHS3-4]